MNKEWIKKLKNDPEIVIKNPDVIPSGILKSNDYIDKVNTIINDSSMYCFNYWLCKIN